MALGLHRSDQIRQRLCQCEKGRDQSMDFVVLYGIY